jgi:hypothetical protein
MSSELDPHPPLPEEPPTKPKKRVLTPEEAAEREAVLEQIKTITTNPALDDEDDAVFFQAITPMLELGRTTAYKNHYRAMIGTDIWKAFTDKYADRIDAVVPQITEWDEARLKQKWAEQEQAERA